MVIDVLRHLSGDSVIFGHSQTFGLCRSELVPSSAVSWSDGSRNLV